MSLNQVYITNTSTYYPNQPVSNDEMEAYLGFINDKPSKSKKIVLRNNGIQNRFYALTKEGKPTHTNAGMTADAIRQLFNNDPEGLKSIQLLSCGTSSPDQMMPSHAVMVHGYLPESEAVEVVSPSGVCCAGMHAFKYAYLAIKSGDVDTAVSAGSERFSASLRADLFQDEVQKLIELEENPYIAFEKDFLRWMLSDGAGALLLSNKPKSEGFSLRVDWLEGVSYANEMEACMYMGSEKNSDGTLTSYLDYTPDDLKSKSVLSIKQDVKLLSEHIIPMGGRKLKDIFDRRGIKSEEVDHFLPHMSSAFFRSKIYERLEELGIGIPYEKWRVNLDRKGNVGAASIYLMIDELFKSDLLKKGDKILMLVPESSRFSYMYGMLTVC
ncbi:MAG: StlD/DarB family beta-ketosynthase [Chitinophagaceae bacterium]|nr:MAG: StlD/DarB family beta-ketosynthase [Chitinophagaceae bacterium]